MASTPVVPALVFDVRNPTPSTVITSGDVLAGVVRVNLAQAQQLELTAVTVTLRGKMITVCGRKKHKQVRQIMSIPQILWQFGRPLTETSSGYAEFPFSIQVPTQSLPPSFNIGNVTRNGLGGLVVYYLHLKGSRRGIFTIALRKNSPLAFIPSALMGPLPSGLQDWKGPWEVAKREKKVRKNVLADAGSVQAELTLPELPRIPLFTPIPYRLKITCTSRQVTKDLTLFDFPRSPAQHEVNIKYRQFARLRALGVAADMRAVSPSLGGLGGPPTPKDRDTWHKNVEVASTGPDWLPTQKDKTKGSWTESVAYSGTFILQCQPPFGVGDDITYQVFLDCEMKFPGLGNSIDMAIGPLKLYVPTRSSQSTYRAEMPGQAVSGASQSTDVDGAAPPAFHTLDLPPTYWEAVDRDEKDD